MIWDSKTGSLDFFFFFFSKNVKPREGGQFSGHVWVHSDIKWSWIQSEKPKLISSLYNWVTCLVDLCLFRNGQFHSVCDAAVLLAENETTDKMRGKQRKRSHEPDKEGKLQLQGSGRASRQKPWKLCKLFKPSFHWFLLVWNVSMKTDGRVMALITWVLDQFFPFFISSDSVTGA